MILSWVPGRGMSLDKMCVCVGGEAGIGETPSGRIFLLLSLLKMVCSGFMVLEIGFLMTLKDQR